MHIIHKYLLKQENSQLVEMPRDAQLLTVQMQRSACVLWALISTENSPVKRQINMASTGWQFDKPYMGKYIASVQFHDYLVAHVFDGGEKLEGGDEAQKSPL